LNNENNSIKVHIAYSRTESAIHTWKVLQFWIL